MIFDINYARKGLNLVIHNWLIFCANWCIFNTYTPQLAERSAGVFVYKQQNNFNKEL